MSLHLTIDPPELEEWTKTLCAYVRTRPETVSAQQAIRAFVYYNPPPPHKPTSHPNE